MKKLLLLVLLTSLVACSRRERPVETAPVPTTTQPSQPVPSTSDADVAAAAEAERVREAARRRGVLTERVHFEFDSSDLTDDGRAVLDRKLPILNADSGIRLRIAGHADERGSVEYNLALSLRRANAVRTYLADAGVSMQRMEVVAFGEEQPLETGSNESAWAANRRAEFQIAAGM